MAQTGLDAKYILAAWVAAGILALFGAFTIAGLSKLTDTSGGNYEYMRLCFGNFLAYLSGWTGFIIALSGSLAAIAFIFAQSVNSIIALPNPLQQYRDISIGNYIYPFADSGVKILAIATIGVLTWINYYGIKKGTFLNNFITGAKILGILLLILAGLFFASPNIQQVSDTAVISKNDGFITVFFAAILGAFWAYDGFTNVAFVAGEIKNPKRNVAIAVISGVGLVMILYLLINYAYIRTLGVQNLAALGDNSIAATVMAEGLMGSKGNLMISLLIMVSSFGTLNILVIVYARLYFRMAQENAFFKNAAKVHPKYRTPYVALVYSMIWGMVLVLSGSFDMLTDMVIFSEFLFYALLAVGLIKMKRKGIIKGKVPFYPFAPILFILVAIVLLISTILNQPRLSLIGSGLICLGIPFYFYFKRNEEKIILHKD